jgi:hypothetical protein
MTKSYTAAALTVLALGLLAPASAFAQIAPSPLWGEPIQDASLRFVVLASYGGQGVYDNETGLVWEQSPQLTTRNWAGAQIHCNLRSLGNRKGWRLPTIQELASLIDPTVLFPGPTLPPGHPFDLVAGLFWSATTGAGDTSTAWQVRLSDGFVLAADKASVFSAWCVRGGQGVNLQ